MLYREGEKWKSARFCDIMHSEKAPGVRWLLKERGGTFVELLLPSGHIKKIPPRIINLRGLKVMN